MASQSGDTGSSLLNSNHEEISIVVQIMKTINIKVKRSERIKDFKAKFQDKIGVPGKILGLFFAGKELKDNQTLFQYLVENNSTLNLVLECATVIKLFVRLPPNHRTVVLEADTKDSIQNIKAMIQDKEGIPQNCFILDYSGIRLDDSKTLVDYFILKDATVQVVFNPNDMMNISVKTEHGKTLRLVVMLFYTIQDVKSIIECLCGILVVRQRLVYDGSVLVDCNTLASYNITEESEIHMVTTRLLY
ncbi:hypothetical protein NE237_014362 [Protea cynaroides]|uniref:Ubiquitin-like domain-containing protein n=1 Tax=Protea cynaroides TaxID=273540 RepID=A0A9Q0KBX9_9MAGN|nr:hypothetical protein NE237_014362 [Protea cynaroides]